MAGVRRSDAENGNFLPEFEVPKPDIGYIEILSNFFIQYGVNILIILVILAIIIVVLKRIHSRQKKIEKLWIFILFFLTKRQMLIPLVISLSKKDKLLDDQTQKELLSIRDECRQISLKKDPEARMEMEEKVSEILFHYFTNLDRDKKIQQGTKFEKIVRDLEFIDGKLVQLQKVYNREVERWNKIVTLPGLNIITPLIKVYKFEVFK